MRPRLGRAHRRFDYADVFGAEDLVELTGELAVAVTDQNPRTAGAVVVELHQQVARLLSHPAAVGVGRDPRQVDAAGRKLDEEQGVEPLEEERISSVRARSPPPSGSPTPCSRSSTPRPTSSPWIRRYPRVGFSRTSRTTIPRISAAVAGLPGRRS